MPSQVFLGFIGIRGVDRHLILYAFSYVLLGGYRVLSVVGVT